MRVYLDNCCYNRPFDEQAQLRVLLETEAKLRVQAMMRNGGKGILKKIQNLGEMRVANPVDYVMEDQS